MILDDTLLDDLETRARQSPRLRMNLNLHDSLEAKAQRLLNALEPGTAIPIHRHRHTSETYAILRGRMFVVFYDSMGGAVRAVGHPGGEGRSLHAPAARGYPRLTVCSDGALTVYPAGSHSENEAGGIFILGIYD